MLQKFKGPLVSVATVCVMFYVWLSFLNGQFDHIPALVTGMVIGIVCGANFFSREVVAKARRLISRQPKLWPRRSQLIAHGRHQGPRRSWRTGLKAHRSRHA
jgi:hypothetical protein